MTKIFLQTLQANVRLIIGLVLSIAASIGVNVAPSPHLAAISLTRLAHAAIYDHAY